MPTYRKRRRRRRRVDITRVILVVIIGLLAVAVTVGLVLFIATRKSCKSTEVPTVETTTPEQSSAYSGSTEAPESSETEAGESSDAPAGAALPAEYQPILLEAKRMAAMYDYMGAVDYIEEQIPDCMSYTELSDFISQCEADDSQLVTWADNTQITHIFFHTLIYDEETAFGSDKADAYNQVMTTMDEFNAIIQQMYERGYVMVRLSDIAEIGADGQMHYKNIRLPEGKIPFVLSEDDVSYYEYMNVSGGYAQRLVVTADGKIMNEVDNADGTVTTGAFDVVPLIDEFVEEHPDFSYHGAKGIVALTGYNGILGYRTSYITYGNSDVLQAHYNELFVNSGLFDEAHAYDLAVGCHTQEMDPAQQDTQGIEYTSDQIEAERAKAKTVAQAIKEDGWEFASHTWGHMDMSTVVDQSNGAVVSERFYRDSQWWTVEVEALIGETDTIIFAKGADIGSWRGYGEDNAAYLYLKQEGFDYFCNVDSSQYYVQMSSAAGGSGYLRQGRRNLDGLLMFKALVNYSDGSDPTKELTDIIDVWTVFDFDRPLPVKGVGKPEGFSGVLTKPDGTQVTVTWPEE